MDVNDPSAHDDEESSDAGSMEPPRPAAGAAPAGPAPTGPGPSAATAVDERLDLTPRAVRPPKKRQWWAFAVLALIIAGVGFVAVKALNDATLFFYNADEAVAMRDTLGTDRFRLQGTVESGTIVDSATAVDFKVQFNGVEVAVSHIGDPPELFEAGMPVVLEGRWNDAGDTFESDRMLIKHDENYEEKNDDRLKEAEEGGQVQGGSPDSGVAP